LSINFFFDNKNQKIDSNITNKNKLIISCLTDKKEKSDYDKADKNKYLNYSYNSIKKQNDFFQNSPISDNSTAIKTIIKDFKQQRKSSQLTIGLRDI